MSYPQATTTDPYAFALWPDASEEELAVWAQAAEYAQQELTGDALSFGLDATAAWGQSSTLPAAAYGPHNPFETDWISSGTGPVGDILGHQDGPFFADTTATDAMAFAPDPTPPFPTDTMDALTQDFFFGEYDFGNSLSGTPSLTNESSIPSPQSDGTGNGLIPFPTFEGASSYSVQPSSPSSSQHHIAGASPPNQVPSWLMGNVNLTGQSLTNYWPTLDLMGTNGNMSDPIQLNHTQASDHLAVPTGALATMVTAETVPSPSHLGKRSRKSEGSASGPQKRAKTNTTRVLGEAESTKRTRSPATRTQQSTNHKSKAAGRGAGRLTSTTAQGVYRRTLLGHSVSQGSMGALEQGQPSWIEEREVEAQHDTGSAAPLQIDLQNAENVEDGDLHAIPRNLSVRNRSMLETTQADEERGAVRNIRCKLCPTVQFGKWETFKRHCKSCEKHPSKLRFCPKCGDYFARPDSEIRHREVKKYQDICLNTSQEDAEEKKQMVEQILREFEAQLEKVLRNGEDIGSFFSDIVNKKLTNTSKKVSKQEKTRSGRLMGR